MEKQNSYKEEQEVSQYEKLATRTKELFETAREKTPKALEEAFERAREEMIAAGDFSREQARKIQTFVQRDLKSAGLHFSQLGKTVKETLEPQRVASGIQSTVAHILDALGDALKDLASKAEEHLTYRTGELSSPGTLKCNSRGKRIYMATIGRVPPCAKCHGTDFRKSY
jgi:hypothetical protein